MSKHVYCYGPQRSAVESMLNNAGLFFGSNQTLKPTTANQLRGLEGFTFAHVPNHPYQPPDDLLEMMRVYGAIVISLDDSYLRARRGR